MRFAPTASAAAKISEGWFRTPWSNASKLTLWEGVVVVVQKFLATERFEAL
jgi:hypothetical protein